MCQTIWKSHQPKFVAFPSQAHWEDIAQDFWGLWNCPLCVGAIDDKHVQSEPYEMQVVTFAITKGPTQSFKFDVMVSAMHRVF